MSRRRFSKRALACAAVLVGVAAAAPLVLASPCTGPMYIYYETSAMQTETGAKLVCPTVTIYDDGPNGTYQETPYFIVETMSCPCGGGGGGGGDPFDQ